MLSPNQESFYPDIAQNRRAAPGKFPRGGFASHLTISVWMIIMNAERERRDKRSALFGLNFHEHMKTVTVQGGGFRVLLSM